MTASRATPWASLLRASAWCVGFAALACGSHGRSEDAPPAGPVPATSTLAPEVAPSVSAPAAAGPAASEFEPGAGGSARERQCGPIPVTAIRALGPDRYELQRAALAKLLRSFETRPLWDRRVIPEKVGERIVGVRVFGLPLDGRCGLITKDRVESVQGIVPDGPDSGREIARRIVDVSVITIDIRRDGEAKRLSFVVR